MKIQRYTWDHLDEWYYPDPNGEWVKWEDIKEFLKENRKMSNVFCMKCGRRISDCICDLD